MLLSVARTARGVSVRQGGRQQVQLKEEGGRVKRIERASGGARPDHAGPLPQGAPDPDQHPRGEHTQHQLHRPRHVWCRRAGDLLNPAEQERVAGRLVEAVHEHFLSSRQALGLVPVGKGIHQGVIRVPGLSDGPPGARPHRHRGGKHAPLQSPSHHRVHEVFEARITATGKP